MFERIVSELKAFRVAGLSRRELCGVTSGMARVRAALDALEVRVATAVDGLDDKGGDAESMMRAQGHMSTREARRRYQRAEKLRHMPNTARKLACGEITGEHADALVRAAETISEGLVDGDEVLLATAARRPADLAGRDIRDWTAKRQRPDDREEHYRQQRRNRSLVIFKGDDAMRVAHCRSDDVTGELLRSRIEELARRLHRQDKKDHENNPRAHGQVRSWEQLRHDALMTLLGIDNTNTIPTTNDDTCDGNQAEGGPGTADVCECGGRPKAGTDLSVDNLLRPVGMRNQMLVVADIDAISGRDPNARMEIPGVGPIPKSVLDRLACDAEIFGLIFNGAGVCLWHGRSTRTVSPQQWRALVARDRGCVLCAAHPSSCEAHHIIEWLDLGETEIENLALLCVKHHHQIHEMGLILIRDGPALWHTTPKPTNRPNQQSRDPRQDTTQHTTAARETTGPRRPKADLGSGT